MTIQKYLAIVNQTQMKKDNDFYFFHENLFKVNSLLFLSMLNILPN